MGIRIDSGKEVWNGIRMGESFTLVIFDPTVAESMPPSSAPAPSILPKPKNRAALFDAYLFIDYSGADALRA